MKRLAAINLSLALVFSFLSVAWGTAIYTGNWARTAAHDDLRIDLYACGLFREAGD